MTVMMTTRTTVNRLPIAACGSAIWLIVHLIAVIAVTTK